MNVMIFFRINGGAMGRCVRYGTTLGSPMRCHPERSEESAVVSGMRHDATRGNFRVPKSPPVIPCTASTRITCEPEFFKGDMKDIAPIGNLKLAPVRTDSVKRRMADCVQIRRTWIAQIE